ncbi:DUF2953 domain-containing protein [Dichotomicrobium thermohalophilum]|uniref:DUF2953 domain-containing protein n=1 Tax=Dichotomicrobium thermohalophilum TaxID=933063 RepID=A0A397PDK4_9HYPH|nr:DUF2953 domain-containing protein [Dichotomicrobium thermohalophilum]RIA47576.1 Protein of unknown function (DUF2953) [Dichotomicrobium thermohalophilum]
MIAGLLWALLAILLLILAGIVAVTVTPVRLRCVFSSEPQARAIVVVRLFAGLIPPLRLFDSARREAKRAVRREPTRPSRTPRPRTISRVLREVPTLLADLLTRVRLRQLTVDADLGLGDPADTGQLFGLFQAVRYACPAAPRVAVQVRPDFEQLRLAGRLSADLSFIPVTFVSPVIRFAWRSFGPGR